ncbi:hypothetical protein L596_004317 [Steinernema carpocapsae]|uniref:WDR36/Utp21 C-terminal domain-containing protein n=1 Tax=Steinernema carpocapsae TaxID=34508 RepID=A0A4V6YSX4_STECR|nr:hypothetical protein L596_004317 [Steinernema carpocapsae]
MAFAGYSSGHVDVFNIQSGACRGSFIDGTDAKGSQLEQAHHHPICGVESDQLNRTLISCDTNGVLKFWNIKEMKYEGKISLASNITKIHLNRANRMVAVAFESGDIKVVDILLKRTVRHLKRAHRVVINDMTFSPDGKWMVTSDSAGFVKVWDLMTNNLIDVMSFEHACIGLSFTENGAYLATIHAGQRGIYLWANMVLFGTSVNICALKNDERTNVHFASLPNLSSVVNEKELEEAKDEESDEEENVTNVTVTKAEDDQMDCDYPSTIEEDENEPVLVGFSGLPPTRWANLPDLDIIRARNKPKEGPKKPVNAPFFLPSVSTVGGFEFEKENVGGKEGEKTKALMAKRKLLEMDTVLMQNLYSEDSTEEESGQRSSLLAFENLKQCSISSVDFQISSLPVSAFARFFRMCRFALALTSNFEVIQAYVSVMFKYHNAELLETEAEDGDRRREVYEELDRLMHALQKKWDCLENTLLDNASMIQWIKSALI